MLKKIYLLPRKIVLMLIVIYQYTLSPDHSWVRVFYPSGVCRFTPTCSQYTYQAVAKYGIVKGVRLGTARILRCNPWHEVGHDPVP
ncbi:MAG: membrane protein insertion efficiency factor YidD [Patescibacteria group bacterium]